MYCFLTPNAPVIAELGLVAALLLANHTVTAQGDVSPDPVVGHGVHGLAVTLEHDLLAGEALVGLLEAALVHAQPTAVAEGALQDVLRAHTAVGGLAEQIRVAPAVLALAEDVPAVQLPARPLDAAPEGEEHGQQHRAQRPQDQVPVRKQAGGGRRPLLAFHLLQGRRLTRVGLGVRLRGPGLRPCCRPRVAASPAGVRTPRERPAPPRPRVMGRGLSRSAWTARRCEVRPRGRGA